MDKAQGEPAIITGSPKLLSGHDLHCLACCDLYRAIEAGQIFDRLGARTRLFRCFIGQLLARVGGEASVNPDLRLLDLVPETDGLARAALRERHGLGLDAELYADAKQAPATRAKE